MHVFDWRASPLIPLQSRPCRRRGVAEARLEVARVAAALPQIASAWTGRSMLQCRHTDIAPYTPYTLQDPTSIASGRLPGSNLEKSLTASSIFEESMPRVRWSPDTAHHKSERLRFMSSSPSNLRPQLQSKHFEGRTSLGISEPNMHRRGMCRLDRANRVKASSAYLFFWSRPLQLCLLLQPWAHVRTGRSGRRTVFSAVCLQIMAICLELDVIPETWYSHVTAFFT